MRKILIFGNSSSGKSTLAKTLEDQQDLTHLDLDTLAWLPELPPTRAPLVESQRKINTFMRENESWVIEGCYTDLLELVEPVANEIIFMNIDVKDCIKNAYARPWEQHKYESKDAQDENLDMLINWIKEYKSRDDENSYHSHMHFYEKFTGNKKIVSKNRKIDI